MIKVTNLTKTFDDHIALSNVNLNVKKGSVYGLVGPNGSGKTTMIKHIMGIYRQDKGIVSVCDENIYNNTMIKQKMVYIPDDLYFPPTFSAMDMAKFYASIYENFSWEKFNELSKIFAIDNKKRVAKLSKGMQKQVAFWICISCNPEIIIMDEPVDGLDPVMRKMVWGIILKEVSERKVTVLISSHNLRELEDVCDHVGILHQGKMLLEKPLDDMKSDTHKLQIAFADGVPKDFKDELCILHESTLGKVSTFIIRGNKEELIKVINKYNPVLFDIIPLTLEEVFIYELGGKGYDFKNILY